MSKNKPLRDKIIELTQAKNQLKWEKEKLEDELATTNASFGHQKKSADDWRASFWILLFVSALVISMIVLL